MTQAKEDSEDKVEGLGNNREEKIKGDDEEKTEWREMNSYR